MTKTDPFDKKKFKKGIASVESSNGKFLWNDNSSATGRYQFLYNDIKHLPEMRGVTREQFRDNPKLQETIMDYAIQGKIKNRPGYFRNANDLTNEFSNTLGNKWNYRPDEVAALTHYLGRKGARDYFKSIRDGKQYNVAGKINTTVDDYLNKYNNAISSKRGISKKKPSLSKNYIQQDLREGLKIKDATNIEFPDLPKINHYQETKEIPKTNQIQQEEIKSPTPTEFITDYINNNEFMEGGQLQNNMDIENLLTEFNTGGSHEQNPLGGIPQGVGANGKLNTVEEGETKSKDYVFSDRLTLDETLIKKHGLPKNLKGKTMADASKYLNKIYDESKSKIDKDTTDEMIDRLKGASEETRLINEINNLSDENKFFLGGLLGGQQGGEQATGAPGVGAYLQAAQGAVQIGQGIFGDTGIDTSGATGNQKISQGAEALSGLATGVQAGSQFGPIGAGVGAVVGGIGGLISGGRKKKDAVEGNRNFDLAQNAQYRQPFMDGGFLDNYAMGGYTNDYMPGGPIDIINSLKPIDPFSDSNRYNTGNNLINSANAKQDLLSSASNVVDNIDLSSDPNFNLNSSNNSSNTDTSSFDFENLGNTIGRLAPAISNFEQLSNIGDADIETRDRIDSTYRPEFVDERSLVNRATSEYNNTANSLKRATNGSYGALRSNLLAAHLNRQIGLGNTQLNAVNQNRQERRFGQNFRLRGDSINLNQSNLERDVNARNAGAHATNKSRLQSAVAENVGDFALEQERKKYPERLGLLYNYLGKYRGNG